MKTEEAIRLLHPDTTAEAIAEIEYKHGFRGKDAAINKINKACEMACKSLEKQIPKKPEKIELRKIDGTEIYYICPGCGLHIPYTDIPIYCKKCGQALDWSDNE